MSKVTIDNISYQIEEIYQINTHRHLEDGLYITSLLLFGIPKFNENEIKLIESNIKQINSRKCYLFCKYDNSFGMMLFERIERVEKITP